MHLIFYIVITAECLFNINGLYCKSKSVFINGTSEAGSKQLLKLVAPSYRNFRSEVGINATIQLMAETDKFAGNGTVVFANTPFLVSRQTADVEFPMFARAIVVIYNLPGITNLNLTLDIVSSIYMDRINYWNDFKIVQINPNAVLPDAPIKPVFRSDNASAISIFIKILTEIDPTFNSTLGVDKSQKLLNCICYNSTCGTSSSIVYGEDVVGMIGIVKSFAHTIGIVYKDAVTEYTVSYARILKIGANSGNAVEATKENVEKAMRAFIEHNNGEDFMLVPKANSEDKNSYDLVAYTYFAVNYSYNNKEVDCCTIQELVGFVDWFYSRGNDDDISNLGYIPILDELTDRIKQAVLGGIRCNGEYVYPLYLETIGRKNYDSSSDDLQTALIASVVSVAFVVFLVITVYVIYRKLQTTDDKKWMLDPKRVKIVETSVLLYGANSSKTHNSEKMELISIGAISNGKSDGSRITTASKRSETLQFMTQNGELDELRMSTNPLLLKSPDHWSSETRKMVSKFKGVLTRHVATLLGVTTLGPSPCSIYEFCAKGTLHHVLKNTKYDMGDYIKYHFALDISNGLKYLHHNGIMHGLLSSLSCYVDSSWTVKIIFWEQFSIYRKENPHHLKEELRYTAESLIDVSNFIRMLYLEIDVLENPQPSADVFSFGFLLMEIFYRKIPYALDVDSAKETYPDILNTKFTKQIIIQPMTQGLPPDITYIIRKCIGPRDKRPLMPEIVEDIKKYPKVATAGIVDVILDTLEKHADALEGKVEERTMELKKVTGDMRKLLNEVLPPQIAEQLLAGHSVMPEQFECVTVYFSDIVGFTTVSAMSSPSEVMKLLNDLWVVFDKIIERFNVYKVDTIGDAYMVCSGLPERNGMRHCKEIALLALALREKCSRFKIKHLPDYPLNVRIGINSGPVTAGVVGSKMPQYCVFGDTVNTAARMESTSLPQKIQLTERSHSLLTEYFPGFFEMAYRGEISVKGKGEMKTYWLLDQINKIAQ